jgi:hypothetical protein
MGLRSAKKLKKYFLVKDEASVLNAKTDELTRLQRPFKLKSCSGFHYKLNR